MKYLIDTNIFLRVLTQDDEKTFKECVDLLRLIKEGKIKAFTTTINIVEIVWTLHSFYSFSKKDVIRAVNSITYLNGLKIQDGYDYIEAFSLYKKHTVKFVDCILASIPKIKNRTYAVLSFDKDFNKLKVIRKEPRELL